MAMNVCNHLRFSFAESLELVILNVKNVPVGTVLRSKFDAGGMNWVVTIELWDTSVTLVFCQDDCREYAEKRCCARIGNSNTTYKWKKARTQGEKSKHTYKLPRASLLDPANDYLDQGNTLLIKILVQDCVWYPPSNTTSHVLSQMLQTEQYMDAEFVVGHSKQKVRAHKSVLQIGAPALWEIVRDAIEPVELPDSVSDTAFRQLLHWIYRGEIAQDVENLQEVKALLYVASLFDVKDVKMHAESLIVEEFLSVSNAAELMMVGNDNCCALLQEAAMEIYLLQPKEVMQTEGWKLVHNCPILIDEILEFSNQELRRIERWSIGELRDALTEYGLGKYRDSSRATMVKELANKDVVAV